MDARKTIDYDKMLEKYAIPVMLGTCALTIFAGYKLQEVCIRNAIRKANAQTVDYILEQFRYIRR